MDKLLPQPYLQHRRRGPFPGRIDPWAEIGRYFKQIHAGMISQLLEQMQDSVETLGYSASREASLQIAEGREPDIFIQRAMNATKPDVRWNYTLAAEELLAEPGIPVESEVDLEALHIKQSETGKLVTVIEIVSPGNKAKSHLIADYRMRRDRLLMDNAVNIVEIDTTRSVKHLLSHAVTADYPYHIAIYLPDESPHFIGVGHDQPLPRIAVPLRGEAVAAELQIAYEYAYQVVSIAWQIHTDARYTEAELPFPSLLSDSQRHEALAAVSKWQAELERLRT